MKRARSDGPERLMASDLIRELLGERKNFAGVELVGDEYNLKNHRHFEMLQHYMQSRDFSVFANRIVFSKMQFKGLRAETLYMPYMIAKGALMDKTDLSRAVLNNADLRMTGLRQAKLAGTDFTASIMNGALLLKADMTEAILVQVAMTDATLSYAILNKADLSFAKLSFSKFDHADLRSANLTGATLFQANFEGANLSDAILEGALLEKTNFQNANLMRARFAGARLDKPNFSGANLEGATGINATWTATTPLEIRPLPSRHSDSAHHGQPKTEQEQPEEKQTAPKRSQPLRTNRTDWILTSRLSANMPARGAGIAASAPQATPTTEAIIAALKAAGRLPADYTLPSEQQKQTVSQPEVQIQSDQQPTVTPPDLQQTEATSAATKQPSAQVHSKPETPAKQAQETPPTPEPPPEPRVFEHAIRVPYADADPMGVVYYSNYLMYFDIARASMFRQTGLPYGALIKHGLMLPVVEAVCKYKASALCDDLLAVFVWCDNVEEFHIKFAYEIRREATPLAFGFTRHKCINAQGKIIQPFPELLKLLGR